MCRAIAEGGRRCARSARLEKLIAAELAPATAGAPELDWAHDDLTVVWAQHDRDVVCAALETVESAAAHDGRTFVDMEVAAAAAGGALHGAAFRLKSPGSLARKIVTKREAVQSRGTKISSAETAATITDVTRYTALSAEHDQLVPTATATVTALTARGWTVIEAEQSYLPGNPYKGLHLLVRHEDGQVAELQIQSIHSQQLKDRAHQLYEISRDRERPLSERRAAAQENKALYDDLPAPAGLDQVHEIGGVTVREKRYT